MAALSTAAGAAPGPDALDRCRLLVDDRARLACYDVLLPPPAKAAAAATAATAASEPTALPADFGLQRKPVPVVADALQSQVAGRFDGWSRGQEIVLVNGQVWQVSDDSVGVYRLQNPKVTVRRGAFGSFFLEVEGVPQSPRVRRVK